ncbi:DnaJ domain-containing protein 1 [Elsinoe fawcettii]|nr:DnaJ domain-containing protein 1 [Elsinoe fawcettii]
MKLILSLLSFFALVAAWSAEDHEIFRLRDELIQHEGANATFYNFLGVKPSASQDDINRAYRKQSRLMHPDKARANWVANFGKPEKAKAGEKKKPGSTVHKKPTQREIKAFNKEASARFARLGVVTNILRGPERERYDHFMNNGFPKWRGTGYYYARFRPGLGSVLFGLFVFVGGGFHYLALYIGWKKQREFVERYIKHARRMAWGNDSAVAGIPGLNGSGSQGLPTPQDSEDEPQVQNWNRREKRAAMKEKKRDDKRPKKSKEVAQKAKEQGVSEPQDARMDGPVGAKRRTVAENGKVLIVDSVGNVWLEEETEEGDVQEFLLDPNEIAPPTVYDTVLFKLPKWAYNKAVGRFINKDLVDGEGENLLDVVDTPSEENAVEAATSINANGEARKRRAKAGRKYA